MDKSIHELGVLLYQLQDNKFYVLSALAVLLIFAYVFVKTRDK